MTVAIVALVGLLWGSFANVLIARVPSGQNWVSESSRCPQCKTDISWYDNVPVVSYLVLRARCRSCGKRISARYPMVELTTAAAFVGVYALWGLTLVGVAFAYLALISIVLLLIDIDVKRLPDILVLPSYAVGAVVLGTASITEGDAWSLARAGIGILVLGGFYGVLWFVYPSGMGFGDVKTAGLLGMFAGFLGWSELGLAWFAGPILGGLMVLGASLVTKVSRKTRVPYGPALIIGAWVGYVWGEPVISMYMGLFTG